MRLLSSCLILLSLLFFSCGSAGTPDTAVKGALSKVKIDKLEGIPAEYGPLVAVTTHAQYEAWSQLWFVDKQNTIRMVRVQFHDNKVHEKVLVIPRN